MTFPPDGYPFSDGPDHIIHADHINSIIEEILAGFVGPQGQRGIGTTVINYDEDETDIDPDLVQHGEIIWQKEAP